MAGERRFDGDFRCFGITNFTDHDDVRVLAEDGAQGVGEGEADFFFHRHLIDAGNLEFNRVFDRDDVVDRIVEFVERGIKRGRLAGTGRAGDENQSVRRIDRDLDLLERVDVEAELVETRGQV